MNPDLRQAIEGARAGREVPGTTMQCAMEQIMAGRGDTEEIKALLLALKDKGETVGEIVACAQVMRRQALQIGLRLPCAADGAGCVDLCGTGGDAKCTINVSTLAAFVVAGAGVAVLKHGNRSVSSHCGSADLLESLGARIDAPAAVLQRCLDEARVVFLFAPLMHPAMRHAMRARRELGMRTIFNLLGPLTNPAGVQRQLVGVYDGRLLRPMAEALQQLGARHALVVHGRDGLDEVSTTGPTAVAEVRHGQPIREYTVQPGELGVPRAALQDLIGETPERNGQLGLAVLRDHQPGPHADIVVLNAACALYVSGVDNVGTGRLAEALPACLERARASLCSGRAFQSLERLIAASRQGAPAAGSAG